MRVFLFEWVTGGGLLGAPLDAPDNTSLVREGSAMVAALAADLESLPNVRVILLRDHRLPPLGLQSAAVRCVGSEPEARAEFARQSAAADWSIVIAPEIDGCLIRLSREVIGVGGRLLGTHGEALVIASDKHRTAEHLARAGVPTPRGGIFERSATAPREIAFPAVLKPCDGAGSQGVRLVRNAEQLHTLARLSTAHRLEEYRPGIAASVAVLCGPTKRVALPACRQRLTGDGKFQYLGGSLPIDGALADRAARLAMAALDTLPDLLGYCGVDLVLGPNSDGRDDVVVEINPRLTTSYVGLRALAEGNLAGAMIELAEERTASLSFASDPVEFDADGTVRPLETTSSMLPRA